MVSNTFFAVDFNPRSPHGERRRGGYRNHNVPSFQSTLPARGATNEDRQAVCPAADFNPRSPHGERQHRIPLCSASSISIHAPRTGSDAKGGSKPGGPQYFNPRSPHGERPDRHYALMSIKISIHAPRTGSDPRKVTILSIRIIDFAQKVYHKTVLLRISLAENAVILPEKPRNPVRTSLQKAGGLRFARAIRAAHPYSISSPSGA